MQHEVTSLYYEVMRRTFHHAWHPDTAPEASIPALDHGLQSGKPFSRPLTRVERLTLTLAGASPRSHLVVAAPGMDRREAMSAWSRLRKRLERASKMPAIVYIGTCVRAGSADDWHFHFLIWGGYLHWPVLAGHAHDCGLGTPSVTRIGERSLDRLSTSAYVFGQAEPVVCDELGRNRHERNAPRRPRDWSVLRSHDQTMRARQPEVLSALHAALDPTVTDDSLARATPFFSRGSDRGVYPSEQGVKDARVGAAHG